MIIPGRLDHEGGASVRRRADVMPACAMGSSGLQRNRRCRRNIIFNILRRVPPVRNIQHNVVFCTSPRKDSVWHNRAESYPFRMFPCGMFTPPLWRQAATPTTAPKLLPFFAPPADCACGVPGRPLPPCGVPEIFGGRLRRPLRGAGRNAPPKSNEQGKSVTTGRISLKSIEGINHITNT